jgi:hypothetical protein
VATCSKDDLLGALFLIGSFVALIAPGTVDVRRASVAGLLAGLGCGTKYTNLVAALGLMVVAVGVGKRVGRAKVIASFGVALVLAGSCGCQERRRVRKPQRALGRARLPSSRAWRADDAKKPPGDAARFPESPTARHPRRGRGRVRQGARSSDPAPGHAPRCARDPAAGPARRPCSARGS